MAYLKSICLKKSVVFSLNFSELQCKVKYVYIDIKMLSDYKEIIKIESLLHFLISIQNEDV